MKMHRRGAYTPSLPYRPQSRAGNCVTADVSTGASRTQINSARHTALSISPTCFPGGPCVHRITDISPATGHSEGRGWMIFTALQIYLCILPISIPPLSGKYARRPSSGRGISAVSHTDLPKKYSRLYLIFRAPRYIRGNST